MLTTKAVVQFNEMPEEKKGLIMKAFLAQNQYKAFSSWLNYYWTKK